MIVDGGDVVVGGGDGCGGGGDGIHEVDALFNRNTHLHQFVKHGINYSIFLQVSWLGVIVGGGDGDVVVVVVVVVVVFRRWTL